MNDNQAPASLPDNVKDSVEEHLTSIMSHANSVINLLAEWEIPTISVKTDLCMVHLQNLKDSPLQKMTTEMLEDLIRENEAEEKS